MSLKTNLNTCVNRLKYRLYFFIYFLNKADVLAKEKLVEGNKLFARMRNGVQDLWEKHRSPSKVGATKWCTDSKERYRESFSGIREISNVPQPADDVKATLYTTSFKRFDDVTTSVPFAMPYSKKYTPPQCLFFNFAGYDVACNVMMVNKQTNKVRWLNTELTGVFMETLRGFVIIRTYEYGHMFSKFLHSKLIAKIAKGAVLNTNKDE